MLDERDELTLRVEKLPAPEAPPGVLTELGWLVILTAGSVLWFLSGVL